MEFQAPAPEILNNTMCSPENWHFLKKHICDSEVVHSERHSN